ncbi:MAG: DNA repair helicase XPB [Treponemataceae bacterium]
MPELNAPLIIQSDRTILLDVHAPQADDCRNKLIPFAELERSPEHLHTYRLTPLSLWNASSAGFLPQDVVAVLESYARYPIPQSVIAWIEETASRFGKLRLVLPQSEDLFSDETEGEYLFLETAFAGIYKEIEATKSMQKYINPHPAKGVWRFSLKLVDRGNVKQHLLSLGWPVKDEVPLRDGEPFDIALREKCLSGKPFAIRDYQKNASQALLGDGKAGSGYGTIVLPCGAGKTVVGMYVMSQLKTNTLIVTTNISAVHQWIQELVDKTTINKDDIGEYTGEYKQIKPVTVATYQVLTWRADKEGTYPHFKIFSERAWGLIIYDEVHLLPAPVFRVTAELQAIRRLGLTATLVREDRLEGHVFSLVGPKRYDVPWKELEAKGWIAHAQCIELRIDLPENQEIEYAIAGLRTKHRIASDNQTKIAITKKLIQLSPEDQCIVIGQYIDQLEKIAAELKTPLITGKTPNLERDRIYQQFRNKEISVLVVSKVANFAIDLPDASMAIQISGTFGSRQEEAQRLGRILRPKERTSRFFTLITRGTVEEEFGANRQKFLAEQGYDYKIIHYEDEGTLENL